MNHTIRGTKPIRKICPLSNSVWLDYKLTPLAKASASGIVKNAQLFVENGAADFVWGLPKSRFGKCSALFIAASHGHVDMVHYLIEQGAQSYMDTCVQKFLPTLIDQYLVGIKIHSIPQGNFLECLILILNAWRGKVGIDRLRENGHAEDAVYLALEKGHSDIADILMSYGVQPRLEKRLIWSRNRITNYTPSTFEFNGVQPRQEICLTWAKNGIKNNNLPMLEMLHRRQLFDFIGFRNFEGHTLLVLAITHNNTAALKFLQKIGVPNVIGKDGKSDSETGHEEFTKSVLIAILDAIALIADIRPCFATNCGKIGLKCKAIFELDSLLRSGIDLNFPIDDKRNTLLYHAVKGIFNSIARKHLTTILNYGANPYQAGISGITPLMEAERVYQEKQVENSEEDRLGAQAIIQRMQEFQECLDPR